MQHIFAIIFGNIECIDKKRVKYKCAQISYSCQHKLILADWRKHFCSSFSYVYIFTNNLGGKTEKILKLKNINSIE